MGQAIVSESAAPGTPVADAWRAMPQFARAASNLSAAAPLEPAKEQEHLGTCDS